jgi:hypothetical protein
VSSFAVLLLCYDLDHFIDMPFLSHLFKFRVKSYKKEYVACPKAQKPMYSKLIYDQICSMDPPGRFLKQDSTTKLWHSIGKKKAIDKTRQALREGAPELLKAAEGGEDKEDSAPAATSGAGEQVIDGVCSLKDFTSNNNLFRSNPNRPGHLRFMSDVSIDSILSLGDFRMGEHHGDTLGHTRDRSILNSSWPEAAGGQSSQAAAAVSAPAGNILNHSQAYSHDELNSFLRIAQMQMIQQHINEWQQLCNTQGMLQNTEHTNTQFQLQALNLQLNLQNAWNQPYQQMQNPAAGTAQSAISSGNSANPDLNSISQNTSVNTDAHTAPVSLTAPNTQPQESTRNALASIQDFNALLAAIQNNRSGGAVGTSSRNSNADQSGGASGTVPNELYQQLQSQLAYQQFQNQLGSPQQQLEEKVSTNSVHPLSNFSQDSVSEAQRHSATPKAA